MSITRSDRLRCACGAELEAFVADSLNADRHPHLRELVLTRKLHVFRCDACGAEMTVEKELLYIDLTRAQFIGVFPRRERHRVDECARVVGAAFRAAIAENAPGFVRAEADRFLVRLCFGLEELREKLVLDEAGLSDLVVEELKCRALTGEPWFGEHGVAYLRLESVDPDGALYLVPVWMGPPPAEVEPRGLVIARAAYDAAFAAREQILAERPALAAGPHVSMLRLVEWPPVEPAAAPRPLL